MTTSPRDIDLPERFEAREILSRGPRSVVLRALDRELRAEVALKVPTASAPSLSGSLSREFRVALHLSHPNLVPLFDLVEHERRSLLVMELVRGTPMSLARIDARAMLPLFRGLALGIAALHDSGLTHGDLKPSNVVLTADDRPVLVDFGAAVRIGERAFHADVGNLAYMAPEQWFEQTRTAASDWYAFGLMLCEACLGRSPFGADPARAMPAKRRGLPPAALRELEERAPRFAALCGTLLRPDPSERQPGSAILSELGVSRAWSTGAPFRRSALVGRQRELGRLRQWMQAGVSGRAMAVIGAGGVGKSAILDELVSGVSEERLVLASRCHPGDSSSLRGLDDIVRDLVSPGDPEATSSLSAHERAALRWYFPTCFEEPPGDSSLGLEQELAWPVVADAIARLIHRRSGGRPTLLVLDDVHFSDAPARRVLGLLAARPHDGVDLALIFASRDTGLLDEDLPQHAVLVLEPLDEPTSRELLESLCPERLGEPESHGELEAALLASHGNPLYLESYAGSTARSAAAGEDVLSHLLGAWRDEPRLATLLRILAVLETAILESALTAAVGGEADGWLLSTVRRLRARRVVLTRFEAGARVELHHRCWKDAIVSSSTPDELREAHLRVAGALAELGDAEASAVAQHFRQAGALASARMWDERAVRAARALGRWHVVSHHLELLASDSAQPDLDLLRALAESASRAGRSDHAARCYLRLAEAAPSAVEQVSARRLAAEHWLLGGRHAEAKALLREVLDGIGIVLPSSASAAVDRLRGWFSRPENLRFEVPPIAAREADPQMASMADAAYGVTLGLAMSEPFTSGVVQTFHADVARLSGDPARMLHAAEIHLVQVAGMFCDAALTAQLVSRVQALADEVGTPAAHGTAATALAGAAWMHGRHADALEHARRARSLLSRSHEHQWHRDTLAVIELHAHQALGDWNLLERQAHAAIDDARLRDDRYLLSHVLTRVMPLLELWRGAPAQARERLREGMSAFPVAEVQLLHVAAATSTIRCALYDDDLEAAALELRELWSRMERHGLAAIRHYVHVVAEVGVVVCALRADEEGLVTWRSRLPARDGDSFAQRAASMTREELVARLRAQRWADPVAAARLYSFVSGVGSGAGSVRA